MAERALFGVPNRPVGFFPMPPQGGQSFPLFAVRPIDPGSGGSLLAFRMRGFDQNGAVNDYVFWESAEVDSDASDYAGSAGPVVDIVVHKVLGA